MRACRVHAGLRRLASGADAGGKGRLDAPIHPHTSSITCRTHLNISNTRKQPWPRRQEVLTISNGRFLAGWLVASFAGCEHRLSALSTARHSGSLLCIEDAVDGKGSAFELDSVCSVSSRFKAGTHTYRFLDGRCMTFKAGVWLIQLGLERCAFFAIPSKPEVRQKSDLGWTSRVQVRSYNKHHL